MNNAPPAPIVVSRSPVAEQIASAMRTGIVLLGGIAALLGFIGRHDAVGLLVYLQSGAFVPIIGAASAIGAFVWAQWQTIRRKRVLVVAGEAAPDSVIKVVP